MIFHHFVKRFVWEIAGCFLILLVLFVNQFPEGYVLAGEDTHQRIHLQEDQFSFIFYDWQGRANLFYAIFYFLESVDVSPSLQLSCYLGLFLLGSFFSFLGFLALIFEKIDRRIAVATALFYALNLYTLYVFTYSWGYSQFQSLYIFIPILVGVYVAFLRTWKTRYAAFFALLVFLCSSGFSNPAFFVSFGIFFGLLTIFLALLGFFSLSVKNLIRLSFVGIFSLLVSAYWFLPLLPQIEGGVTDLAETNSINLSWWLKETSTPISETLRLGQYNSGSFFPYNNPYEKIGAIEPTVLILSFLPILLILFGIGSTVSWRDKNNSRLIWAFFGVLVLFIALNARVRFPFEGFNNFFFQLPGLNTLRSYEKIAIFTPFLIAALLALVSLHFLGKRTKQMAIVALVVILLLPAPFYFGKLQQSMSFILSNRTKDFQQSSHSFLVKIPEEYYGIREIINTDADDFKIASLPYNTEKIGWVSYPKWKMRGSDVTETLYKAPFIQPNSSYLGSWFFAKDFNDVSVNPVWMADLLGLLNTKYIIYHKDVRDAFIEQTLNKIQYLENEGIFVELVSNNYFNLYKLKEEYILPYVYLGNVPVPSTVSRYTVSDVSKFIKQQQESVEYNVINPRKIIINFPVVNLGNHLILNERYDPLWLASYYDKNGKRITLKRDQGVMFANAWHTNDAMSQGTVVIEYLPMKLFFIGSSVSGITLLAIALYFAYNTLYERKRK